MALDILIQVNKIYICRNYGLECLNELKLYLWLSKLSKSIKSFINSRKLNIFREVLVVLLFEKKSFGNLIIFGRV